LAFRSEAHINRWCEDHSLPRGAFITLDQCWRLAQAWYPSRLNMDWRRMDAEEMQAVFTRLGLTGEFWRVA
jgi:hypothetical protein